MNIIVFVLFLVAAVAVLKRLADKRNVSLPLLVGVFVAGIVTAALWFVAWLRLCI